MIHNFKTGKLGLSDPEIEKERQDIFEAMCKRTPTELHRGLVLDAMKMANTLLCYDGALYGRNKWDTKYAPEYHSKQIWDDRGYGAPRKYGCNKVQNEAYHLTHEETDAIWKAQAERFIYAKVVPNVHRDEDGCSYNAIKW